MKHFLLIASLFISVSAFAQNSELVCSKLDKAVKYIPLNLPKRLTDKKDQDLFKKYFPKRRIELGAGAVTYCINDTEFVTYLNFYNAKGEMVASLDGRFFTDDYSSELKDKYSFNYDGEQGFSFMYDGKKLETRDVFTHWYDVKTNYNLNFTLVGLETYSLTFSCDSICRSWQR